MGEGEREERGERGGERGGRERQTDKARVTDRHNHSERERERERESVQLCLSISSVCSALEQLYLSNSSVQSV